MDGFLKIGLIIQKGRRGGIFHEIVINPEGDVRRLRVSDEAVCNQGLGL